MIHAFLLVLVLGGKVQGGTPMYFYDIERCNFFASQVVKRYGNYSRAILIPQEHKATAYCKPVYVEEAAANPYK